MEANPGTVEAARFSSYAAMGVNRFSIGVQSFDDLMLGRLGRIHTAQQAHQAIEAAQRVVDNINIDVMFALPGQTMQMLTKDLETAIASQTTHLSFYELTLEEGTAFAKRVPEGIPDTDRAATWERWFTKSWARRGLIIMNFRLRQTRTQVQA